ncbi:MAG: hypothetical protein FWC10_03670 [Lentimicrobiaceae bacterium]|nr:hypothetical protein [Lentimicrobiaceae bacterium]
MIWKMIIEDGQGWATVYTATTRESLEETLSELKLLPGAKIIIKQEKEKDKFNPNQLSN